MNKKKLVIILMVVISLVVAMLIIRAGGNQSKVVVNDEGGEQTVNLIDKNQKFYNLTTYKDYLAIKNRLTDFVVNKGQPADTDVIVSSPSYGEGQSTVANFNIGIPSLGIKETLVQYDYGVIPSGSFKIPEFGYSTTLYEELD